jgi:cyclic pyranopterin phosphate synthase
VRDGGGDDAITAAIRDVWSVRDDRYSEQRSEATEAPQRIEMSYIGG